MNIYTSEQVRPYVYMGVHKVTGEIYIGYREANSKPSHLDIFEYRTSSKVVNPAFDDYDWYIIAEFKTGLDAYDFEQQLIFENWNSPLLLNKNCQFGSKKRFRNITGLKGELNPRWGKKLPAEQCANMSKAKKGKLPANIKIWTKSSVGVTIYYNPITQHQIKIKEGGAVPAGYVKGNKKVSISNSLNPRNPAPVFCIELNKGFNTVKRAAEFVGLKCPRDIMDAIHGRNYRKTAGGYHWTLWVTPDS